MCVCVCVCLRVRVLSLQFRAIGVVTRCRFFLRMRRLSNWTREMRRAGWTHIMALVRERVEGGG